MCVQVHRVADSAQYDVLTFCLILKHSDPPYGSLQLACIATCRLRIMVVDPGLR